MTFDIIDIQEHPIYDKSFIKRVISRSIALFIIRSPCSAPHDSPFSDAGVQTLLVFQVTPTWFLSQFLDAQL